MNKYTALVFGVVATLTMVGSVSAMEPAMMKDGMMMKDGKMVKMMYKKGMANWHKVSDAHKIHFFYKEKGMWHWQHAIRDMHPESTNAMVQYLDGGKHYVWAALIEKTNGSWMWTPEMHLDTMAM